MDDNLHWNNYWNEAKNDARLQGPSQFAALVVGEFPHFEKIVDIGSGGLRDSNFFAVMGKSVLAVDAVGPKNPPAAVNFLRFEFGSEDLVPLVQHILVWSQGLPVLLYSRFFLHSISPEAELDFWQTAREVASGHEESVLVLEFRDDADRNLPKETAPHFRRFSSGNEIVGKAMRFGFRVMWKAEGRGMAKFGNDDAHVTRLFLRLMP